MKAARIHEYGASDRVRIEEVAMPEPSSLEVMVRIDASGINPVDWKIREGMLARAAPRAFPFTLGQDFAGQVIAIGDGVTGIEVDEDVYGFANGSYAEYAVVSPDEIALKPTTIDEVAAAELPTPGLTALQVVRDAAAVQRGQAVLIQGAAGGVGTIATQLCVGRGARVIATAGGGDAAYLRELGVAEVIDYKSERFEDRVRDVDVVIDLVGGETLARSFAVVKRGGLVVTTVGPLDPPQAAAAGVRGVQFWMRRDAGDLRELARLVDDGSIKPRRARVLPLVEAKAALDLNQFGATSDKVVLLTH
jgi:NADPH:quinone reductase-like Zn-dependent oxidoreductase